MKVRMAIVFCAAVLAQLCVLRSPSDAASRLTEDFADLIKRAPVVVEVKIERCRQEENAQVGLPLTIASAQIVKVLRGNIDAKAALELEKFGGESAGNKIIVPGQVEFIEGTQVFALLTESPLNNGRYRVLGGDAGYVLREKNNVRRATGRFDYFIADEKSMSGFVSRQSQSLHEGEFNALVSALLETGRPVITQVVHTQAAVKTEPALPVINMPVVTAEKPSTEAPLFFRVGAVLAFLTLAWGAQRLARAMARAK